MARLFLDANILIDITEERKNISLDNFEDHKLFISPLSIHILTYMYKYRMPDKKLLDLKFFGLTRIASSLDEAT